MASAVNSIRIPTSTKRAVAILVFSLPLVLLAVFAQQMNFTSTANIHALAQAFVALDRGTPEMLIRNYPPLPALLATALPSPYTLLVVAALVGGATLWLLWQELRLTRQHPLVSLALLTCMLMSPALTFLATQSLSEMIAVLLFVIAWRNFLHFMREGTTYHGFAAGLVLGIAFYASIYAVFYALIFVLMTPLFLRTKRVAEQITAMAVVGFPAFMAFITWAYLNWIFTGRPFGFWGQVTTPVVLSMSEAFSLTLQELTHLPIYLMIGLLIALYTPRRLFVYAAPLLLVALGRMLGLVYSEAFAITLYSVIAIIALPRRAAPVWGIGLAVAAIMQVFAAVAFPAYTPELQNWQEVALLGHPQSPLDREVATLFAAAPDRSILADSKHLESLMVLTGSARPFLLPTDSDFQIALSNPEATVDYLLIQQTPSDSLLSYYGDDIPAGFVSVLRWADWTLYQNQTSVKGE